ncbi:InlB B-repeat-containing protein [Hornefia porci]|nr:InlB B-repeat-containing protein [Hornefia porci]
MLKTGKRVSMILLSLFIVLTMIPAMPVMAEDGGSAEMTVSDFFTDLNGIVKVTEPTDYPYTITDIDGTKWLKGCTSQSGTIKKSQSATLTFVFTKAATLTFDYKMDTNSSSGLVVKNGNTSLYTCSSWGAKVTGVNGIKEGSASVQANAGDTVTVAYRQGNSSSRNSCMYLKNFKASLPSQVTFHGNNGTDETKSQTFYGTGTLDSNSFSYDGHIFKGWADSADGEVKYADKASVNIQADTDLYAVWASVYAATFTLSPEDAQFSLYSDSEYKMQLSPDTESARRYTLENGTYYWKASVFGYAGKSGRIEIGGAAVNTVVSLVANKKISASFSYDGDATSIEGGSLTVKTGEQVMTAKDGSNGLVYELPTGYKYTYTFKSRNYTKQTGEIDLTGDVTEAGKSFTIPLSVKTAWGGSDDIEEPQKNEKGVYQISTGAELAWLAQEVNAGRGTGYDAVLSRDIDLGNEAWTPIGSDKGKYAGTFDGNGKTISNLNVEAKTYNQGLFGYVNGGTIRNLTVKGTVTGAGSSNSGGVGGIVGTLNSTYSSAALIENCVSYVAVTGGNNVGGIVGIFNGSSDKTVRHCANFGQISGANSIGGIGGHAYGKGRIEACYNRGTITAAVSKAAGIIGYLNDRNAVVSDCYTTGAVSGGADSHPFAGLKSSGTVTNCYYLDSLGTDTNAAPISEENLRNLKFATPIPDFCRDMEQPVNDGYPILSVQDTTPKYELTVLLDPGDTELSLQDKDGGICVGAPGDNKVTFQLRDGAYNYTASAFGKVTKKGTITIAGEAKTEKVTLEDAPGKTVSFDITCSDGATDVTPVITVRTGDRMIKADAGNSYRLPYGEYTYTVKAKNYKKVSGTITIGADSASSIPVVLEYSRSWDGETIAEDSEIAGSGSKEDPYLISNGEQLAWLAARVNAGNKYNGKYFKQTEDIDLGDNNWTPVGKSYSYIFAGNYDGNGRTVSGLSIEGTSDYNALFGMVKGDAKEHATIRNLTVKGSVSTSGRYAAGIAGYAVCLDIENCRNEANITTSSESSAMNSGGIIGYMYGTVSVSKCSNSGTITGTGGEQLGGIAGAATASKSIISECFNTGKILGKNRVGGIAGYFSGANSKLSHVYNTGDVSGVSIVGGIAGGIFATAECGYSLGTATGTSDTGKCVGKAGSSYLPSEFYFVGTEDDTGAGGITADALRAKAAGFNEAAGEEIWKSSPEYFNEGYPVFSWQEIKDPVTDKTTLNDDIAAAENYLKEISGGSYADAAKILSDAVNAARAASEDTKLTQNKVDAADKALRDAIARAKAAVAVIDRDVAAGRKTEADAAKASADRAKKAADASRKAAEEAMKTPGEDAVKAAEQAKKDAETAAEAARKSADAADAAVKAAEKAAASATKEGKEAADTALAEAKAAAVASAKAMTVAGKAQEEADELVQKARADKEAAEHASAGDNEDADIDAITPGNKTADSAAASKNISGISASGISITAQLKSKAMKVKFRKVKGATNYRIAYRKAGEKRWTYAWTAGKNTCSISKMRNNGLYEFRLAVYQKNGDTWQRSTWSRVNYRMYAGTKASVRTGKRSATVRVKKVSKATGYQVIYSSKRSMAGGKTKNFAGGKKTSLKIRGLKKGRTYYIQVSPVRKYKGHIYLGIQTGTKKVRVK